jgi:hypothetical protein
MYLQMPRRPLDRFLPTSGDESFPNTGKRKPDRRRPIGWFARLLAETAWPPASDIWLKDPNA